MADNRKVDSTALFYGDNQDTLVCTYEGLEKNSVTPTCTNDTILSLAESVNEGFLEPQTDWLDQTQEVRCLDYICVHARCIGCETWSHFFGGGGGVGGRWGFIHLQ